MPSPEFFEWRLSSSLAAGWEDKFRGLVLEAIWPSIFGAEGWQPTQAWQRQFFWLGNAVIATSWDANLCVWNMMKKQWNNSALKIILFCHGFGMAWLKFSGGLSTATSCTCKQPRTGWESHNGSDGWIPNSFKVDDSPWLSMIYIADFPFFF